MKKSGIRHLAALLGGVLLVAASAFAQFPEGNDWRKLTPEERSSLSQQMREEWNRLTPNEREARKAAHRKRMESLSPQEREAERARFKAALQQLPPDQREQLREAMRRQHRGQPVDIMPPGIPSSP